jgi:hypothetical protein
MANSYTTVATRVAIPDVIMANTNAAVATHVIETVVNSKIAISDATYNRKRSERNSSRET